MSERRAFGLVIRLGGYYVVLAAVAWLVGQSLPRWGPYVAERTPGAAAVAMLGGLALMCPVAWLYMRTKPKVRYDASLVQTVIVLPIVIAGVVLIIRDSVALAFSLAGIVAAVLVLWRFDVGAEPPAERFRGRLIVEAAWAPGLEPAMVGILERYTRRWKLLRTEPTALTFAVQLRREGSPEGLVAAVREEATQQVTGARFEPNVS